MEGSGKSRLQFNLGKTRWTTACSQSSNIVQYKWQNTGNPMNLDPSHITGWVFRAQEGILLGNDVMKTTDI